MRKEELSSILHELSIPVNEGKVADRNVMRLRRTVESASAWIHHQRNPLLV